MVSYYLPCHQGASPQTDKRRSHHVPTDSLIQKGDSSSQQVGVEGLGCTMETSEAQEPVRGGEHRSSDW
jgi:hypothetical protein